MALAILCSGQGGQHAGMFDLTGNAPQVAALFAHAATLLGEDPRILVKRAERDVLHANRTAQLLCTLQALSAIAVLNDVFPRPRCVAGYSVGEVAAWGVAGLIGTTETLDLVAARAGVMDAASHGDEGMLFIRGLGEAGIEQLCVGREAAIAICNPADAWVLGGRRTALEAMAEEARRLGAARVVSIPVNVPSHTYLLADASVAFSHILAGIHLQPSPTTGTRLFSGIDGDSVLDAKNDVNKLALQISQPIQWARCLDGCVEAGAVAFLELGPGRALADMAAGAYPHIPTRSVDDFRSVQGIVDWLSRVT
ncbi:malonate decarboxylase subunit epsilon [Dyella flava]|uniref:Malonate decarboxylase subunit epsilon n=1 Tax=Dyella flava TaxID=1920170 RepID=A0ABS2JYN5_9GAMM|nr:malonate decarboxylase subunit epsilon [Dyella flava]MBM7124109.1 malonate decarboxylase subunit epsilon [Dyella flava]GLQ50010.1 malonate decarboxylase subunit epsilon [Dyella flava]